MKNSQRYSIYGVGVQIECSEPWLAEEVGRIASQLSFIRDGGAGGSPQLSLRLTFKREQSLTSSIEDSCQPEGLHVVQVSDRKCLADDGSIFYLEDGGDGLALLDPSFRSKPIASRTSFLLSSVILLMHQGNLYELHAAGLVKDGLGVLLVAGPECGKSTTTVSLIRQGWRYLSDDLVCLQPSSDGVRALALRKALYVDPVLAYHYPELTPYFVQQAGVMEGKCQLNIESAYPGRHTHTCLPRVLLFLSIIPKEQTELVPMGRTKALARLIGCNRSIILDDRDTASRRIETLKRLVQQADCYELQMGLDLYHDPARIADFIPLGKGSVKCIASG